ncbi:hypothetical protein [Methylobacterium oryzae]|uniref:hypothetical protein n=1 Tax=Methylobacterium oryzae TaxID=334852 RepID=UPI002F35E0AE
MAKITAVVPERLRPFIADPSIGTPSALVQAADGIDVARARTWIREGRKIRIHYRDVRGDPSRRVIWLLQGRVRGGERRAREQQAAEGRGRSAERPEVAAHHRP